MSLTVVHEPADVFAGDAIERCCMCRAKTRYWYRPNDVAMCPSCAKVTRRYQVPTKAEWIAKERKIMARQPRNPRY